MVGSEATDRRRHRRLMDGGDGGLELELNQSPGSGVSCSICLDLVSDDGERSRAKLHCGHEFHLDCIGSAFNMKGAMQCPNCRKVEKGQWLYANGSSCSFPEFNMEDWIPDEDPYDLSYAEMPFRVHWCPYGRLARLRSSFEEMEYPSTTYNGFPGHHAMLNEHASASSAAHSYIAVFRPIQPTSSNSTDSGSDDPNLNHRWNGPTGHNEIFDPHTFPAISNQQHHNWAHHAPVFPTSSSHVMGADLPSVTPATQRSSHGESDAVTRSRSFPHPFTFVHGSGPGAGSLFVSSVAPHHPSNNARTHAFNHQQQANNTHMVPGIRRLDNQRSATMPAMAPPQLDHNNLYSQNPENPWEREGPSHFSSDRDSGWPSSFHQAPGNSNWHRQWPWRS